MMDHSAITVDSYNSSVTRYAEKFSEKPIFFNSYQREFIKKLLKDDYPEDDDSSTPDVFIFSEKLNS